MERIIHFTADPDANGVGLAGFQDRVPGISPATVVTEKWLNEVQEEQALAIEGSGQTLAAGAGQLWQAMQKSTAFAAYQLSGSNIATDSRFTLTTLFASDGFSLTSNEITLPGPGVYELTFSAILNSDSGSKSTVDVYAGSDVERFWAPAQSSGTEQPISGSFLFQVTFTGVDDKVSMKSQTSGGTIDVLTAGNNVRQLYIKRIHLGEAGAP